MSTCVPYRVHGPAGAAVTGVGIEPTTYGLKDSRQAGTPSDALCVAGNGADLAPRDSAPSDAGVRATVCPQRLPLTGSVAVRLTAMAIASLAVEETLRRVVGAAQAPRETAGVNGSPRCGCGHARTRHRQANHLRHERGACTQCDCAQYAPGAVA